MNLITDDWRLKLLAVALGVLMLGAVAFSQNPPTTGSVVLPLNYSVNSALVLINPPARVTVTYSGLADVLKNFNPNNLIATVDATNATPGPAVRLNVTVHSLINGVNPQRPAPIAVHVDARQQLQLAVTVVAQPAPGWSIDTSKTYATCAGAVKTNPCTVTFDGPVSWEKSLTAYVTYPSQVNVKSIDSPSYFIQLKNSNGALDSSSIPTSPPAFLDVTTASIHITGIPASGLSTVPLLDSPPSQGPPPGYRVTGIVIDPILVTISGEPITLGRVHIITLPPVDLSGRTTTTTFQIAIPYPDGITGTVANAKVTYTIAPNPNVSPGPSPGP